MRKQSTPLPVTADEAIEAELRTWAWLVDARATWIEGFHPADLPNFDKALAAYIRAAEAEVKLLKAGWLLGAASGASTDPQ
jgi:hypothetical protein